jgi:hypothetical protein
MRNLGLVFSFLVTLSLVAAALSYVPGYVGQQRIYVGRHQGNTDRDTARTAPGDSDPYYQRYYSESQGWTYYALPSYSSARQSGDQ